jgi:hypothetical protein
MYGMSKVSDVVVWVSCGSVGVRVLLPYYKQDTAVLDVHNTTRDFYKDFNQHTTS